MDNSCNPWPVTWVQETSSTMHLAREMLSSTPSPFVVAAHKQTAGYGRRGTGWDGGTGNLLCTVVLPSSLPSDHLSYASLAVAVATAQTTETLLNFSHRPTLKWPNDVRIAGAKVAGILIETIRIPVINPPTLTLPIGSKLDNEDSNENIPLSNEKDRTIWQQNNHHAVLDTASTPNNTTELSRWIPHQVRDDDFCVDQFTTNLLIGIGLNLQTAPIEMPYPVTALAALGEESPSPEYALETLLPRIDHWMRVLHTVGKEAIIASYLSYAEKPSAIYKQHF